MINNNVKFLIIIILATTSGLSTAECIYLENNEKIKQIELLRNQANMVLDAEGDNCSKINKQTERSICQCSYRLKYIEKFREIYTNVLTIIQSIKI